MRSPRIYRIPVSLTLIVSLVALPVIHSSRAAAISRLVDTTTRQDSLGNGINSKRPPLRFELNVGQSDAQVRFIARTADTTLFLTSNEAVLRLPKLQTGRDANADRRRATFNLLTEPIDCAVIRLCPLGSNRKARITGLISCRACRITSLATTRGSGEQTWRATPRSSTKACIPASI